MTHPETHPPRRRLQPVHVVIALALVVVLGAMALFGSRLTASAVGHGPPTQPDDRGTTAQEAQANSQGQGRQGANSSQDSYTSQNQSRQPPPERP